MFLRSTGTKASLVVMVLIVSGTAFAFSSSAANGPPPDNWTVALYIAADNNLEVAWDMYTLEALLADEVLGQRVTIAGFPIRWVGGDGSMVRLVAIVEE